MKKYIGINTWFLNDTDETINNFVEIGFRNNISLLDYDAVILSTYCITGQYRSEELRGAANFFRGVEVLNENESFNIIKEFSIMKNQLTEMLRAGRNIYVFLDKNESRYIYSGEQKISGTGKNARTTEIVKLLDQYSFLPVSIEVEELVGDKMIRTGNDVFGSLFEKIKEGVYYRQVIRKPEGHTIATISGTDKAISMYLQYEKGKIVFLPCPYETEEYDNEEQGKQSRINILNSIIELENNLTSLNEIEQLPKWTENIFVLDEKKQRKRLRDVEEQIEKAFEEKEQIVKSIRALEQYKCLLTESGVALEEIVKKVLMEIGFSFGESEPNRTDIVAEYGDMPVVVEVKGLTKSAGEKNAAQLEKWISEYFINYGKQPKGILIVNAFRNVSLEKRTEAVFPKQMMNYAENRKHCLLSTQQLLCLYIACKTNENQKEELIQELLETVGEYNKFENIDKYLR